MHHVSNSYLVAMRFNTTAITVILVLFALINISVTKTDGIFDVCPSMKGATFHNTTKPWDEDMLIEKVRRRTTDARNYCHVTEGLSSVRFQNDIIRSSCYSTFDEEYGIDVVDVDNYFPMLSYNKHSTLDDQISTRLLEPSKETNKARIAYIILAHSNFKAIARLIKSVYSHNNVYLIHVDAKAPKLKKQLTEFAMDWDNVAVMPKSFNISWGGVDMVYATLEALFNLLDVAVFDHVINLSAADYPICTQEELGSFLKKQHKTNFDFAYWASEMHVQYRLQNVFLLNDRSSTCQLPDVTIKIPEAIAGEHIWSTSQWFAYNYDFVKYLRENALPHRILAWLETSLIPDESYFGNVLMFSPFAVDRDRNNLHYATFTKNHLHPDVQTVEDFPRLTSSSTRICFARKFDADKDVLVMDMLDDWREQKQEKDFIEHVFTPTKW